MSQDNTEVSKTLPVLDINDFDSPLHLDMYEQGVHAACNGVDLEEITELLVSTITMGCEGVNLNLSDDNLEGRELLENLYCMGMNLEDKYLPALTSLITVWVSEGFNETLEDYAL